MNGFNIPRQKDSKQDNWQKAGDNTENYFGNAVDEAKPRQLLGEAVNIRYHSDECNYVVLDGSLYD
jgi:hypothetical protein